MVSSQQKGVLKDLLLGGDLVIDNALAAHETGDSTLLQSLISSGYLETRQNAVGDIATGLAAEIAPLAVGESAGANPHTGPASGTASERASPFAAHIAGLDAARSSSPAALRALRGVAGAPFSQGNAQSQRSTSVASAGAAADGSSGYSGPQLATIPTASPGLEARSEEQPVASMNSILAQSLLSSLPTQLQMQALGVGGTPLAPVPETAPVREDGEAVAPASAPSTFVSPIQAIARMMESAGASNERPAQVKDAIPGGTPLLGGMPSAVHHRHRGSFGGTGLKRPRGRTSSFGFGSFDMGALGPLGMLMPLEPTAEGVQTFSNAIGSNVAAAATSGDAGEQATQPLLAQRQPAMSMDFGTAPDLAAPAAGSFEGVGRSPFSMAYSGIDTPYQIGAGAPGEPMRMRMLSDLDIAGAGGSIPSLAGASVPEIFATVDARHAADIGRRRAGSTPGMSGIAGTGAIEPLDIYSAQLGGTMSLDNSDLASHVIALASSRRKPMGPPHTSSALKTRQAMAKNMHAMFGAAAMDAALGARRPTVGAILPEVDDDMDGGDADDIWADEDDGEAAGGDAPASQSRSVGGKFGPPRRSHGVQDAADMGRTLATGQVGARASDDVDMPDDPTAVPYGEQEQDSLIDFDEGGRPSRASTRRRAAAAATRLRSPVRAAAAATTQRAAAARAASARVAAGTRRAGGMFDDASESDGDGRVSGLPADVWLPTVPVVNVHGVEVPVVEHVPGNIGAYTPEQRLRRIERFMAKRAARVWHKNIKYEVRKSFADSRLRVKGRFIAKDQELILRDFMMLI